MSDVGHLLINISESEAFPPSTYTNSDPLYPIFNILSFHFLITQVLISLNLKQSFLWSNTIEYFFAYYIEYLFAPLA